MSHTNSTTNYNLPQFVGADKPTWLNDVNGAMSAIDTQMKANADSATSASTTATTAQTAVGTLANLETTAKTDTVSAINEVNTNTGTAQNTANQAYTAGTSALTKVTALEQALNLNSVHTCTVTKSSGITSIGSPTEVKCATNSDGSIFKLYGRIEIAIPSNTGNQYVTLTNTGLPTIDTAYTVEYSIINYMNEGFVNVKGFTVNTDGSITIAVSTAGSMSTYLRYYLLPCVYFNKSFGDTPQPE